ncbi:MAG: hypothetical protein IM638_18415 [Bacteroidetes bacterium]|nr:hypothetical protein [Bacteroidota bacterium]
MKELLRNRQFLIALGITLLMGVYYAVQMYQAQGNMYLPTPKQKQIEDSVNSTNV